MKNLLFAILTILLIASCTESKEARELFARVESVMNEYPDSAFAMLDSASVQKDSWSTREQMRYELLRAKAQNKAYIDFTTDSVMKEVAEYYDAHGTPNEQMEAHYLLGCTYRDLHESPMALSCYLDATEKADTLSDDCDYSTLMRVWGQVADEYDRQAMPYKELEANEHYRKCALKCEDIPNYIVGVELEKRPYLLLDDTLNVINSVKKAYNLFKEHDYKSRAAISLSSLIPIYVSQQNILKAKKIINIFEKESGLYSGDSVKRGYEAFYNSKACYYHAIENQDSAEYYYRKLANYGYDYDGYSGLYKIYQKLGIADSASKYMELMEQCMIENYTDLHTAAMFNAEGMFNYTRNQRVAMQKEFEAERNRQRAIFISLMALSFIALGTFYFLKYKSKKKVELQTIHEQLCKTERDYKQALEDYSLMEEDFNSFKQKKTEEIHALQRRWEELSLEHEVENRANTLTEMQNKDAVADILKHTKITARGNKIDISNAEWNAMFEVFKTNMPHFYLLVINNGNLSDQEQKVAALTIFKLRTNDIAHLLNSSPSNVSNAKTAINKKLFSCDSAKGLYENLLNV